MAREYRETIEKELNTICEDVLVSSRTYLLLTLNEILFLNFRTSFTGNKNDGLQLFCYVVKYYSRPKLFNFLNQFLFISYTDVFQCSVPAEGSRLTKKTN